MPLPDAPLMPQRAARAVWAEDPLLTLAGATRRLFTRAGVIPVHRVAIVQVHSTRLVSLAVATPACSDWRASRI